MAMEKLVFKEKKGFTLTEVMVAAAILAFGFAMMLVQLYACIILNESNRNATIAMAHLDYVLEDIENLFLACSYFCRQA